MVLVTVKSNDRWEAHQEIHAYADQNGGGRYLWRWDQDMGEASVRLESDEPNIPEGKFHFRVTCVPVQKTKGTRRNVVDINEWFTQRFGKAVDISELRSNSSSVSVKRNNRGGRTIYRPTATFVGTGTVTDAELFAHYVKNGIGDFKAYGFGLIEIHND